MVWWQIIGWVGSALVVLSLMQARVLRFRWLNLVGSVLATAYNAVFGIWPFVAMNGVYGKYLAPAGVAAPARTTIEAARLPKDALVEIEVIAEVA